jgi:hypothetical protein
MRPAFTPLTVGDASRPVAAAPAQPREQVVVTAIIVR